MMNFLKFMFPASTSHLSANTVPTESPSNNPISNIPYDLLQEIFLHCLPKSPLDEVQPNPKIAPMLLCHVSSSWRAVALSIPRLWRYFHIRLPMVWDVDRNPTALNSETVAHAIEFMKWWRKNHSSMDPFLRFSFYRLDDIENFDQNSNLTAQFDEDLNEEPEETSEDNFADEHPPIVYSCVDSEVLSFLLGYMSSARYLEVGEFYNYLTETRALFTTASSNLTTLVALDDQLDDIYHEYYQEYPNHATITPPQIPPTVRRLLVQEVKILDDYKLSNWSTLTHLSLNPVYFVQLSSWFTLIRELVNLQWGDFAISVQPSSSVGVQSGPPMFSLPSLLILSISCHSIQSVEYPITTLFQNLELPGLHTLYLTSSQSTWRDSHAAFEIANVLKSAPATTKLALRTPGYGFSCFGDPSTSNALTLAGDNLSKNSSHLQLMLRSSTYTFVAELVREFVKAWVISDVTLNLAGPTKAIPLIIITVSSDNIWTSSPDWKKRLLQHINECVGTFSDISFEINASEDGEGYKNNNVDATLQSWRSST